MSAKAYSLAKLCFVLMASSLAAISTSALTINDVWINEFHYDNDGGDQNEFVEIVALENADLSGLILSIYNGSNGSVLFTKSLSDAVISLNHGYQFLSFDVLGLQNGAPDGLAISHAASGFLQFLSYEGAFMATGGSATGTMSVDIGVTEGGSTPVGFSLQLQGTGNTGPWLASQNTKGAENTGQTLPSIQSISTAVPETGTTFGLLGFALLATITIRRKTKS